MPQRLLVDSGKGWSGWESRFNSTLRMSKASLFTTRVKNEQEGNRLVMRLRQINKNQARTESMTNRDLQETRDHFVKIIATGQVYKRHRFEIYDPYLKEIKRRATVVVDTFNDFKKNKQLQQKPSSVNWNRIRHHSDWQFSGLEPIPENPVEVEHRDSSAVARQRRELEKQVTGNSIHPIVRRGSISSSHVSGGTRERGMSASSKLTDIGSIRSEHLRVKEYTYKRIKRKSKTIIMSRDRTVFPGECKSTYEMRKFMEREATDLIFSFSPEGRRRNQIETLKQRAQLPQFVQRSKSMSAILRDYREYKSRREKIDTDLILDSTETPQTC